MSVAMFPADSACLGTASKAIPNVTNTNGNSRQDSHGRASHRSVAVNKASQMP